MTPDNDDQAAQLKAAAMAARRAARAPWQNAHVDRIIREREARETSKEYRRAQLAAATKDCSSCGETLSLDCFSPAFHARPRARCKACVAAATRKRYHRDLDKARARTRNRPAPTRQRRAVDPDRQRKAVERERRTVERPAAALERQRAAAERATEAWERQLAAAERVAELSLLLMGTKPSSCVNSEQNWDAATAELRKLWLESGDKVCVACSNTVSPTVMMPPGPANFYPGKCRSCARIESEASHRRVYGPAFGPLQGPQKLPLRDGASITLAEFARRVEERQSAYNLKRFWS